MVQVLQPELKWAKSLRNSIQLLAHNPTVPFEETPNFLATAAGLD